MLARTLLAVAGLIAVAFAVGFVLKVFFDAF